MRKQRIIKVFKCERCGSEFEARNNAKYCSQTCRQAISDVRVGRRKRVVPVVKPTLQCPTCGVDFIQIKSHQRFCTPACTNKFHGAMEVKLDLGATKVCTGTMGAIGELVVSGDLMSRGIDVFRALSPSAPFDLVALIDGKLTRVEVRLGCTRKLNQQCILPNWPKPGSADMVAVVLGRTRVVYFSTTTRKEIAL